MHCAAPRCRAILNVMVARVGDIGGRGEREHDYPLENLGPNGFEQLAAALATRVLGLGTKESDGGRDAVKVSVNWSSVPGFGTDVWDGPVVMQVKYRALRGTPQADAAWLKAEVERELSAWRMTRRRGWSPHYLIFVTNARLSPDGMSSINEFIRNQVRGMDASCAVRDWKIWDRDRLNALLTTEDGVRRAFTAMLAPGDVLARLGELLTGVDPAERDYTLGDKEYEEALAVLQRQRNALERSPSIVAKMGEEEIRLVLLGGLNAVFEGRAMGEVFNSHGKTDILIRVNDSNVFIGECKIWHGPAAFREAIDQLLGYLTWRDTKGALLLFIRNADVTSVVEKAVSVIADHPCHVQTHQAADSTARQDFTLHAKGDPRRKLKLALLPFALGKALGETPG